MNKKVLWFSRHPLSEGQLRDLKALYGEDLTVCQVNRTVQSAYELKDEAADCDAIAIVAPIQLQEGFLRLAAGRPVLLCRNHRVPTGETNEKGEALFEFVHAGWDRLQEICIVKETLTDHPAPAGSFRK